MPPREPPDRIDWMGQLQSPFPIARMQATAQILLHGNQASRATEALLAALKDESPGVRTIAAFAMRHVETLASIAASLMLNSVERQRSEDTIRVQIARFQQQSDRTSCADTIVPIIASALWSSHSSDRVEGLRAMRLLGQEAQLLLPTIAQFLHDDDRTVRLSAVLLLGSPVIGFSRDVIRPYLDTMSGDPDSSIRIAITEAMGKSKRSGLFDS